MSAAIPLYVGYDWLIPVTLTDPTTHQPLDISTWTLAGDFWMPFQSLGQSNELAAQNVNVQAASFAFRVPKTTTAQVAPQTRAASSYPCRIMVKYTDTAGNTYALLPILILPLDPRSDQP